MTGPIDVVYVDGVPVEKSAVRGFGKARQVLVVADANEVVNSDLSLQSIIMLVSTGRWYRLDTGDATSAHNGETVLVDQHGLRFKVIVFDGIDGAPGPQGPTGAPGAPGVVQSIVNGTGIAVNNSNPASPVVSIADNSVANAKLVKAGAATLKGNPTGATADVSDFTIQGLTARGAPDAGNDKLPIYDAASGTIKYVTPARLVNDTLETSAAKQAGIAAIGGATLALDFMQGYGYAKGVAGGLANIATFSRASNAWAFDSRGLVSFSSGQMRQTDLGWWYEPGAATNSIPNNTMVGASPGTPGTAPSNGWVISAGSGITATINSVSVEDGIEEIEVRFSGTATATVAINIQPLTPNTAVAATGEAWTASVYMRLMAGTMPPQANLIIWEASNGNSPNQADGVIGGQSTNLSLAGITSAPLKSQRYQVSRTMAHTYGNRIYSQLMRATLALGETVDFTIRLGMPQLEKGARATTPIKTAGAAVTRLAESMSIPVNTSWFSAVEGAVMVDFTPLNIRSDGGTDIASYFDDGSYANVIYPRIGTVVGGSDLYVRSGNVGVVDTNGFSMSALTRYRAAYAYADKNWAYTVNGASPLTNNTGILPVGITRFVPALVPALLHGVYYKPRRASNAQLQSYTPAPVS